MRFLFVNIGRWLGLLAPGRRRPIDRAALRETVTLSDGTQVTIRPIGPQDEPLLADLFNGLTDQSLYQRFFAVPKPIPSRIIHRFCQVDYDQAVALVAVVPDCDAERIVAEARYVREEPSNYADIAFTVSEPFHGKGLGRLLMSRLVDVARRQRLDGFTAEMLATNSVMIHLFHTLGLDLEATQQAGICAMRVYLSKSARRGSLLGRARKWLTRTKPTPNVRSVVRGGQFGPLDI